MDQQNQTIKIDRKIWILFSVGAFFLLLVGGFIVYAIYDSMKANENEVNSRRFSRYDECSNIPDRNTDCSFHLRGDVTGGGGLSTAEDETFKRHIRNGLTQSEALNEIYKERKLDSEKKLELYKKWKNGEEL
jgi:hypothetical protein